MRQRPNGGARSSSVPPRERGSRPSDRAPVAAARTQTQATAHAQQRTSAYAQPRASRNDTTVFHRQPVTTGDADDAQAAAVLRSPRPIAVTHASEPVEAVSDDTYVRDGRAVLSPSAAAAPPAPPASIADAAFSRSFLHDRAFIRADFDDIRQRAAAVVPAAMADIARQIELGLFGPTPDDTAPAPAARATAAPAQSSRVSTHAHTRARSRSVEPISRVASRVPVDTESYEAADLLRAPLPPATRGAPVPSRMRVRVRERDAGRAGDAGADGGGRDAAGRESERAPASAVGRPRSSSVASRESLPKGKAAGVPTAAPRPSAAPRSSVTVHKRDVVGKQPKRAEPSALEKLEQLQQALHAGQSVVRATGLELSTVESELAGVQQRSGYLEQLIRLLTEQLQARNVSAGASADRKGPGEPSGREAAVAKLEAQVADLLHVLNAPPVVNDALGRLGHVLGQGPAFADTNSRVTFATVLAEDGAADPSRTQHAKHAAAVLHAALPPPVPGVSDASTAATSSALPSQPSDAALAQPAAVPAPSSQAAAVSVQQLVDARMSGLEQVAHQAVAQLREAALAVPGGMQLAPVNSAPLASHLGARNELLQAAILSGGVSSSVAQQVGATSLQPSRFSLQGDARVLASTSSPSAAADAVQQRDLSTVMPSVVAAPTIHSMIGRSEDASAATGRADTGVDRTLQMLAKADKVCVECEQQPATRRCHECSDDFCDACFADVHKKGARKAHLWTAFSPARPKSGSITRAGRTEDSAPVRQPALHPAPAAETAPVRNDAATKASQAYVASDSSVDTTMRRLSAQLQQIMLSSEAPSSSTAAPLRIDPSQPQPMRVVLLEGPDPARKGPQIDGAAPGAAAAADIVSRPAVNGGISPSSKKTSPSQELRTTKGSLGVYRRLLDTRVKTEESPPTADETPVGSISPPARRAPPPPPVHLRGATPPRPLNIQVQQEQEPVLLSPTSAAAAAALQSINRAPSPRKSMLTTSAHGLLRMDAIRAETVPTANGAATGSSAKADGVHAGPTVAAALRGEYRVPDPPGVATDALRRRQHDASQRFVSRVRKGVQQHASADELRVATVERKLEPFRFF